ncbi:SGNH/GDSL hydrolase family protein [Chamaesiphon sp. VAR_48_metabat_135_sub]|uniref:SGNH/GDSL hydrolase family protein n=1 Tax=Chamaesiphon sp. VAR_48_metabat_135_sub TaxID=2964699 RepID=UPI00286B1883|nr:SGNH/GDSL hydrolase family protein [Chamaesiphon sp. VAR_48_metabat_135_sub]
MTTPTTPEELREILTNPNTTQDEIEQLIERDPNPNLAPFKSKLKVKSQLISQNIDDKWFNMVAREYRQKKYQEKIEGDFRGVKIVSEGDSWFQFPFLLKDVIDWISESDDYAAWSLDAAGDTLENMTSDLNIDKIVNAIIDKRPDIFLISGGGNDMFADGVFSELLNPFTPDLTPSEYLNTEFDKFIDEIIKLYRKLFEEILRRFPGVKIICHGYDYVIPRESGIFMGNNMRSKNIHNASLQREIMKLAIDRLNAAQIKLVSEPRFRKSVFHVDCRGAVNQNNWFDEIHPNNDGFKSVADRFKTVIEDIRVQKSLPVRLSTSNVK